MKNKRYFKEEMEEKEEKKLEKNEELKTEDTKYEPVRRNRFIFNHPLIPSYIVKGFCNHDYCSMFSITIYYPEQLNIDNIFKCKKESFDCDLKLLGSLGNVIHEFKFNDCIAENIYLDHLDYDNNEPIRIHITFRYGK